VKSGIRITVGVEALIYYILIQIQIHNDRRGDYPHPSVEFDRADSLMLSLLALTCQGWLEVNGHNK